MIQLLRPLRTYWTTGAGFLIVLLSALGSPEVKGYFPERIAVLLSAVGFIALLIGRSLTVSWIPSHWAITALGVLTGIFSYLAQPSVLNAIQNPSVAKWILIIGAALGVIGRSIIPPTNSPANPSGGV